LFNYNLKILNYVYGIESTFGGLLPIALTNELPVGAKVLYIMFRCNFCHIYWYDK